MTVRETFRECGMKIGSRLNPISPVFTVLKDGHFFGTIIIRDNKIEDYSGPFENIIYIGDVVQ